MKDDFLYLGDMLDVGLWVLKRLENINRTEFDSSEDLRIVLTHQLQTIGEAASRVSKETRDLHPEIPWTEIIGMRNRIVHDYFNINEEIVWEAATTEISTLVDLLKKFVPPAPSE